MCTEHIELIKCRYISVRVLSVYSARKRSPITRNVGLSSVVGKNCLAVLYLMLLYCTVST